MNDNIGEENCYKKYYNSCVIIYCNIRNEDNEVLVRSQ